MDRGRRPGHDPCGCNGALPGPDDPDSAFNNHFLSVYEVFIMPNALFTELGIWNKAALRIGSQRFVATDVTNPSASSNPAAQYLTDIWPYEVQEFLEEHPWSFAVNTVPMIPLNPPAWVTSTLYNVGMYVLQGGAIYICAIQHTSGVFATDLAAGDWTLQAGISPLLLPLPLMNDGCNNPYFMPTDYLKPYLFSAPAFYRQEVVKPPYVTTATQMLLTTNPNISTMKYVFSQADITQFSAKACEALALKLAKQLCFKVSEAAQYADSLNKEYDVKLISAIANDSNTTSPDEAIADAWFVARLSGSTGAVGLGPDNNNVGWGVPGAQW